MPTSSAIIQDIKASSTELAHLAYFFLDFKDKGKQDARALLSSLVVQLSDQSNFFYCILLALYSKHHRGSLQPSDEELTQCLEDMLKIPGHAPTQLIVDALDECPHMTGVPSSRDQVLALVEKLVKLNLSKLRLLVTSRPEIDIRSSLEPLASNSISLHDQIGQKKDIIEYISSVVRSDKTMRSWGDEEKSLVIETLSKKANGM